MKTNHLTAKFILIFTGATLLFAGDRDTVCREPGTTFATETSLVIGLAPIRIELQAVTPDLALATTTDLKLYSYKDACDDRHTHDTMQPTRFSCNLNSHIIY